MVTPTRGTCRWCSGSRDVNQIHVDWFINQSDQDRQKNKSNLNWLNSRLCAFFGDLLPFLFVLFPVIHTHQPHSSPSTPSPQKWHNKYQTPSHPIAIANRNGKIVQSRRHKSILRQKLPPRNRTLHKGKPPIHNLFLVYVKCWFLGHWIGPTKPCLVFQSFRILCLSQGLWQGPRWCGENSRVESYLG